MHFCRYAAEKFLASHSLTPDSIPSSLTTGLPLTRAWLALASGQLPTLDPSLDNPPTNSNSSTAGNGIPVNLRSGLGGAANPLPQPSPGAAAQLQQGVKSHSWRGLVRLGLVQLAAGERILACCLMPSCVIKGEQQTDSTELQCTAWCSKQARVPDMSNSGLALLILKASLHLFVQNHLVVVSALNQVVDYSSRMTHEVM